MKFIETLRGKAESFNSLNEETTLISLILPFFIGLGYDIFDPKEFAAEYKLDLRNGGRDRVDLCYLKDGKAYMIIEAKKMDEKLDNHVGQLKRYYNTDVSIRYGVLTNGIEYWFFTDNIHKNIMSDEPFFKFNILESNDIDLMYLEFFKKGRITVMQSEEKKKEVKGETKESNQSEKGEKRYIYINSKQKKSF